jgi:hypothetical protein
MTENSDAKQAGRFQKGQSGNPSGKPKGARNLATRAAEALLDGEAVALTRKAIDQAKEGDSVALRLCLERILPARRERSVSVDLPKLETPSDTPKAIASILDSVASGELTPGEAGDVVKIVDSFARAMELRDLEARVTAIEKRDAER